MPRLLKSETNRRLTVCQDTLTLAFARLATPKSLSYEQRDTDGAIEIGLMGIAADLAISACLYEVLGASGIKRKKSGFYVTAAEALESFRSMLTSSIPRLSALTQGVADPLAHLNSLQKASVGFGVLFTARAAAVHAGAGTSYDVAFFVGKTVADFLVLLTESPKWRPYLRDVPTIPQLPKDRSLIANELRSAALKGDGAALTGIFLVLPELASIEPEWLSSLERVRVTPRANDISVLIKSLQHANVGDLFKVGKGSKGIAARIDANNPAALPIYPAAFKKSFDNAADSWSAYVGNANAEIEKGVLGLPPIDTVYSLFGSGLDQIGLPDEELTNGLSAHSLWPFIASSLHYAGTKGPCFFLVRQLKSTEGGQLTALLRKAAKRSPKVEKALHDYAALFTSIHSQPAQPVSSALVKDLTLRWEKRADALEKLPAALASRAKKWNGDGLSPYELIQPWLKETGTVGTSLLAIVQGLIAFEDDKFPVLRLLLSAASEEEDVVAMVELLAHKDLEQVWSFARQAIREIDFSFYGPQAKG